MKRGISFYIGWTSIIILVFAIFLYCPPLLSRFISAVKTLQFMDKVLLSVVLISILLKVLFNIAVAVGECYIEKRYEDGERVIQCKNLHKDKNNKFKCMSPYYNKYNFKARNNICKPDECDGYRAVNVDGKVLMRTYPFFPMWEIVVEALRDVSTVVLVVRTLMGVSP